MEATSRSNSILLDATAVAVEIPKSSRLGPWAHALLRYANAHSALFDLRITSDKMALFRRLIEGDQVFALEFADMATESILGSIFNHCIIIYARATDTSGARGQMPITNGWPRERVRIHEHIIKLRNQVVAHFGKGDDYIDGPWAEDSVYIAMKSGQMNGDRTHHSRVNFKQNDVEDFTSLLPHAIEALEQIIVRRANKLAQTLEDMSSPTASELQERLFLKQVSELPESLPEEVFRPLLDGVTRPAYALRMPAKEKPER